MIRIAFGFIARSSRRPIRPIVSAVRDVQADDVGAANQLRKLDLDRTQAPLGTDVPAAGGVDDLARERGYELCVAITDPAHPDDAKGCAAELQARIRRPGPAPAIGPLVSRPRPRRSGGLPPW